MNHVARFFSAASDVEIEIAYRLFLRKTWLTPLAIISWACLSTTKTGYFTDDDLVLNRHLAVEHVFDEIISFWPLLLIALSFTFGRRELKTVAFGKLKNIWCVVLVGVPLGALAHYAINLTIAMLGDTPKSNNESYDLLSSVSYFVIIVLLTAVQEESWFRLVLQTHLQRFGTWSGVGLTAVLFALFHVPFLDRPPTRDGLVQALVILPGSLIFCLSRRYFGSMLLAVVIHMTTNALAD